MKILRWLKARVKRNVIVVVSMTLLGLLGFKISNFKFSSKPVQSSASLIDDQALLDPSDESVGRDETFTVEQSRVKTSEPNKKSIHQKSQSDVVEVKTGVDVRIVNPNPNLHLFYYGWYGTPQQDGEF